MALFMVSNNLTKEDIFTKGDTLVFPASVISFFKGDLGQPHGGFPKELQRIILKDSEPYTDLPNAHLQPVDFEKELAAFHQQFDKSLSYLDFLSYKFYPKVFEDYYKHISEFGDVSVIPTLPFFFGLKNNEEVLVELSRGKTIVVKLLYTTDADENGIRSVYFKLNGQTRTIEVKDLSVKAVKQSHRKASGEKEVGTPLQGLLSKIFVKAGEEVKKNQPLFTIEAMKMESTITANTAGKINKLHLPEGTLVESEDLVVELA
jgi:pyruvate carboxylase